MSAMVTIEEAQAHLAELISNLAPGEEVVITDNQQPVARLLSMKSRAQRKLGTMRGSIKYVAPDFDASPVAKLTGQHVSARQPRRPGSAKGKLIIVADDEEHLEDFKEYMG